MKILDRLIVIKSCSFAIADTIKDERTKMAINEYKQTVSLAKDNFNAAVKQIYTEHFKNRLPAAIRLKRHIKPLAAAKKQKVLRKRLSCRATV